MSFEFTLVDEVPEQSRAAITIDGTSLGFGWGVKTIPRPLVPSRPAASGTIIYVATDGDDGTGDGTFGSPYATINKADTVVTPGDGIYLKDGDYTWTTEQVITTAGSDGSPIVIRAVNPLGARLRNAQSLYTSDVNVAPLRSQASWHTFDGIIFRGYRDDPSAPTENFSANGLTLGQGSPGDDKVVTNCIFYGAEHCGVKGGTLRATIQGCIGFENGTSTLDHGVYAPQDDWVVDGNIWFENYGWGIHCFTGSPLRTQITRNLSFRNGQGGILLAGEDTEVYNNTVCDNPDSDTGGGNGHGWMYFRSACIDNITRNNIVAFNDDASARNGAVDTSGGSSFPVDIDDDYNNYWPIEGTDPDALVGAGLHTKNFDPNFVDADAWNYQLSDTSQAINVGIDVGLPYTKRGPTLGCYEPIATFSKSQRRRRKRHRDARNMIVIGVPVI